MHRKIGTNAHPTSRTKSPKLPVPLLHVIFVGTRRKPPGVVPFLGLRENGFVAVQCMCQRCDPYTPWDGIRPNPATPRWRLPGLRTGNRGVKAKRLHENGVEQRETVQLLGVRHCRCTAFRQLHIRGEA
jgi:hypothetical protein